MSQVKMNPVFEGFARKMGNMVFFNRKGETFARRFTPPTDRKSPGQLSVRQAFAYIGDLWKGSNGVMRKSWENFARGKKFTGYNSFIAANVPKKRANHALELFKEMGEESIMDFTAHTGASAGQVTVSFTMPEGAEGKHLTVFAQVNENGAEYRPFRRFDLGAGAVSPVAIDGLEPGKPYHLYAVLTDAAYNDATSVSESASAEVVAGS